MQVVFFFNLWIVISKKEFRRWKRNNKAGKLFYEGNCFKMLQESVNLQLFLERLRETKEARPTANVVVEQDENNSL